MENIKANAQLIFSASIFCLAMAMAYFAFELYKFRTGFPVILAKMEKTSEVIYPTVHGIAEISKNIPPIAEEIEKVRKSMPSVLVEVKATRESLPDILNQISVIMDKANETTKALPEVLAEVKQTREMVPGIVQEVHDINAQIPCIVEEVDGIRKQIPQMIQTVDKASDSVQSFSTQLAETNKLIPGILEETQKTREAMPEMLDKAEKIVTQGEQFGSEASKGAVSGLIMGVLNPLNISTRLKDLVLPGKEAPKLTDADLALIRETTIQTIEKEKPGKSIQWENPASKNFGEITLIKKFTEGDNQCSEIRSEIWVRKDWIRKEKTHDFNMVLCRRPDGIYVEKGNPLLNQ